MDKLSLLSTVVIAYRHQLERIGFTCTFTLMYCCRVSGTDFSVVSMRAAAASNTSVSVCVCVCSYKWALVGKCVRISWPCGSAWLVADLWGSPQGITLNLSFLGYFNSFERYLFFPHKATCVCRTCVSFPFPTRHNWRVRKISVCRRSATPAAGAA